MGKLQRERKQKEELAAAEQARKEAVAAKNNASVGAEKSAGNA